MNSCIGDGCMGGVLLSRCIVFFSGLILCSEAEAALGLNECYQAALRRSEDVATAVESVVQADEGLTQAKGAFLPTMNASGIYLLQATPTSVTLAGFSPPVQTTGKFTVTQPLFQGMKEYAGFRQAKDLLANAKENRNQAAVSLFQSLVTSYYQVLSTTQDLKDLKTEIDYNEKRLRELNNFKKLGRSRESEVLTLNSNIAALEAQVEGASGQLENAQAIFAYLTGLEPNTPLVDEEEIPIQVPKLNDYLGHVDDRPDVKSLVQSVLASEAGIQMAQAGHIPTLSALGDYYLTRPGSYSDVNWDFQLTLTIPIFQGGIIQSQVRQAASMNKSSELALSKARRVAAQQIESYYKLFQRDQSQFQKQKVAVELAMKTYESEEHDYRLGLVTNLDVLQSLTISQESQRALDRAQYQMKLDFIQLEVAAAIRPKSLEALH